MIKNGHYHFPVMRCFMATSKLDEGLPGAFLSGSKIPSILLFPKIFLWSQKSAQSNKPQLEPLPIKDWLSALTAMLLAGNLRPYL